MVGRTPMLVALLVTNGVLYGMLPWLRSADLGGNTRDAFLETRYSEDGPFTWMYEAATFRNPGYAEPFFELLASDQRILFLGTSESMHGHNIGNQINVLFPEKPNAHMYAQAGSSPVHMSLLLAKLRRDKIKLPPIAWVINLVYFTKSHDVLNDGWMTNVTPSDTFLMMNHGNVMDNLGDDVADLYDDHFASRRWLTPLTAQKYAANLWFLNFHQPQLPPDSPSTFPLFQFEFDGEKPDYDVERNVWNGYRASDQLQKSRWRVQPPSECRNLSAIKECIGMLEAAGSPLLLVILPPNRQFYAASGLDMAEYDERYLEMRKQIREAVKSESLIDLVDMELEQGFKDRMHADEWGDYQLAKEIIAREEFLQFHKRAANFYGLAENVEDSP